MKRTRRVGVVLSIFVFCAGPAAAEQANTNGFYKGPSLFSTRPNETASVSSIDRFGPVGMGIELHQPAFVMKIKNIEEGSRAGQDLTKAYATHLGVLAGALTQVPGGYATLYTIAKKRFPNDPLPYKELFLNVDPNQLGPELQKAIVPIIRDQLIYGYIGKNRRKLLSEAEGKAQSTYPQGSVDSLTDLYRKIGVHDYDWHNFGPDLRNQPWDYCMFDPKETQAYDVSPWRYRTVTYPAGMEKWQAADFDPAKAGWKTGLPPFGQFDGKLVTDAAPCPSHDCTCKAPMRTLWDKEVLLVHKTFKVPPLKPGHLYRIRTGQGQHVGSGDGYRIYINGKLLIETKTGNGKRTGGKPRGGFITGQFAEDFAKGEITVAATSFLRFGSKAVVQKPPVPQGIFSVWLEEMKLPPLDDEAISKSATVIPMLTSAWQAKQDPDTTEVQGEEDLFVYDGKFVANPKVLGSWTTVAQVDAIDKFTPEQATPEQAAPKKAASKKPAPKKPAKAGRFNITQMTFMDSGKTGDGLWIWSGDTLMDLDRYQALKMTVKTIGDSDYLFIEAGGFSEKNPVGWQAPFYVMKRQTK